jgi:hypothetical protein
MAKPKVIIAVAVLTQDSIVRSYARRVRSSASLLEASAPAARS